MPATSVRPKRRALGLLLLAGGALSVAGACAPNSSQREFLGATDLDGDVPPPRTSSTNDGGGPVPGLEAPAPTAGTRDAGPSADARIQPGPSDAREGAVMAKDGAAGSTSDTSRPATGIPGCKKTPGGSGFPMFSTHEMGTWGNSMGQTSFVDVDKDGDLDFISGMGKEVSWWEYKGADAWTRHLLGSGHSTDVGGVALDVDGDGWVDQVSGNMWYRNLRGGSFERHTFGGISSHDTRAGDLDGDGKPEVVALDGGAGLIAYRMPANPQQQAWEVIRIGGGIHAGLAIGDLDDDGDNDVVRATVWFENRDGKGRIWAERALAVRKRSTAGSVADLDGDGDNDVSLSDHDGETVVWMENVDSKGGAWREHVLATGKSVLHSMQVADFDNDCDLDIYAGETVGSQFIWENTNGQGTFREQVIAHGVVGHETRVGDVDGDGDIDLAAKPWKGGRHVYFRNLLVR